MDFRVQSSASALGQRPSKSYAYIDYEKSISLYAIHLTNQNRDFDIIPDILCKLF